MTSHHNNKRLLDDANKQQETRTNDQREPDSIISSPPDSARADAITTTERAPRLVVGNPQDIICGRGLHIMSHLGNIKLHSIVNKNRQTYQTASRREKAGIAQRIVDEIKSTGTRFIRRAEDGRDDEWIEVDQETAYRKVGHALRLRKTHSRQQQQQPQPQPQQTTLHGRSVGQELQQQLHNSNLPGSSPSSSSSINGMTSMSSTAALHQAIGIPTAVPQNALMVHRHLSRFSDLPSGVAPPTDPWRPLLSANHHHHHHHQQQQQQQRPPTQIESLLGALQQPRPRPPPQVSSMPPSSADGQQQQQQQQQQQLLINTLFANVFQSTLSALVQQQSTSPHPQQPYSQALLPGQMQMQNYDQEEQGRTDDEN